MVYRQKSSRIPSDPVLSDSFRLSEIVGNRRIRLSETIGSSIRQLPIGILYQGIQQLPTGSYRKLSDSCRKLSDCLGFPVGSDGIRQSDCSSWVPMILLSLFLSFSPSESFSHMFLCEYFINSYILFP